MKKIPRGVRICRGYVSVRIMHQGRYLPEKFFGAVSETAIQLAGIHAAETHKAILMGKVGITPKAKILKFKEARQIFYQRHYEDYRDPVTNAPRSKASKASARGMFVPLGEFLDHFFLHEIEVADIRRYQDKRLKLDSIAPATFNREKGMLSTVFTQFKRWTAEKLIDAVRLPEENPCEFIQKMQENERERVADTWELAAAYTWCKNNDMGFWDTIEQALLTALRKSDLIGLDGSLTVKGIQQKTGEKFDLPITLEKPVDVVNFKRRWNALRTAMGWLPGSDKHTTWHDLRHWAPTFLGEQGFSTGIIQNYLGHKKAETSERYTNIRRKALEPAVDVVKRELQRIKETS